MVDFSIILFYGVAVITASFSGKNRRRHQGHGSMLPADKGGLSLHVSGRVQEGQQGPREESAAIRLSAALL